tara:strand:+ start:2626 stop:3018 length:393 start_codon:yes stop_codon:yes gene_type:complete
VVKSSKILSIGNSGLGRCSKLCKNAITKHAEMDAISKLNLKERQYKKTKLFSVRWRLVDGKYVLANAKPCSICKEVAIKCGIKTVYYSNDEGEMVRESLNDLNSCYTTGSLIHMRDNLHYKNIKFKTNNK